ncbi:MAG: adenylate/guanylate cyclase domain-containing protein [Betaproteobacteria bacterium]|nr:adenylate/guanylate cyclase domain-containing protein [Betaproteobacteria bacterium]
MHPALHRRMSAIAMPGAPSTPAPRTPRALDLRYRLFMAGTGLVDLLFTGAYLVVAGLGAAPYAMLVLNLAVFMALNATAAALLFAPVRAALEGRAPARRAYRRLNRLPLYSGLWVFAIGFAYAAWVFSSGAYVPDEALLEVLSPSYKASALAWYALVYATYFALYAAFAANDCARLARSALGASSAPRERDLGGQLVPRLWLALSMLAVLPPLIIVMDLTAFAPLRRVQGLSIEDVIFLDLLATLAAGGLAALFAARQISEPLAQLDQAVVRVARGVYGEPAPVLGDDELGRLTLHVNRMSAGLREREVIRREFGRFVSPEIASRILDDALGDAPETAARELRETTILFSDLRGFTTLAERLPPERMVELMNRYFQIIDETIRAHGGIIHSFIGDAVHASFNFADDCPGHAARALAAALAIQARLAAADFAGDEPMITRIGVHTGRVAAAAVGSEERMNYAMFGDAVNIAMRLEQLNKEKGTLVLASRETVDACAPEDHARLGLRSLGEVRLRGRVTPVSIYQVGAGAGI